LRYLRRGSLRITPFFCLISVKNDFRALSFDLGFWISVFPLI
jgi:hypothetical protein